MGIHCGRGGGPVDMRAWLFPGRCYFLTDEAVAQSLSQVWVLNQQTRISVTRATLITTVKKKAFTPARGTDEIKHILFPMPPMLWLLSSLTLSKRFCPSTIMSPSSTLIRNLSYQYGLDPPRKVHQSSAEQLRNLQSQKSAVFGYLVSGTSFNEVLLKDVVKCRVQILSDILD